MYSIRKVHETYWCSSSIAYQEKRTDCILRIFTFDYKNPSYVALISTLHFFEGQSDQWVTQLVIKPFGIPQSSRTVSWSWKNGRFFQTLFYTLFIFPLSPLPMLFASIWDSLLAQASVLVPCQYAATLSRWKGPDLFLKSGPFQNFHKYFQEWTWSQ